MRTALKSTALQFAVVAMVLRALLPAGWMPAATTSANASPFVICIVYGPLHSAPAKHSQDHDRAGTPCVFAAWIHAAAPTAEPAKVAPATLASPIVFAPRSETAASSSEFRPNTARAPPAFG